MQALLTVEQLAEHLQKSVASIRSDATRNPHSLPPICRLPNTKRLLWRAEDVERWIGLHVAGADSGSMTTLASPEKRRRGRPTKAESVAKRAHSDVKW
ncbi:DNA-binding protein [Paraburkholderia fungorum]|uniref:DNA-binding protein n=1 Tax=Paraburkholderia fungorum TaxID=134537 RepID=UPI00402BC52E